MKKTFMGVKLRRLREERGMSQIALAHTLGLSPSYLNQLEQNQRPLTVAVLLKINRALGLDVQMFSEDEETRLMAELRDVVTQEGGPETIVMAELKELASNMPAVARTLIRMHHRHRDAMERLEAVTARVGDERGAGVAPMPYEEVRDFFTTRHNYIPEIDEAAERLAAEWPLETDIAAHLRSRLEDRHGVRIQRGGDDDAPYRRFDASSRVLQLSRHLDPGQASFQMATQLAFLELGDLLHRLSNAADLSDAPVRALARIGLANYFAGAVLLPYGRFLSAAETLQYDIDRLGSRFGVGFETVCHRLSTLQRPTAPGVPFFFIRVDRAGNISKRQSATHFHFSRVGGTCPLWNVYEAFAQPGRILTQLARMPDDRTYLWIARTVSSPPVAYGALGKTHAVALGCDVRHAPRLAYSKGLDLNDRNVATPIGMGCKVCEREACSQRAFPFVGSPLDVDENRRSLAPYPASDIRRSMPNQ